MIDTYNLIIQAVVVPALCAPIVYALGNKAKKTAAWISFLALLYPLAILSYVTLGIFSGLIPGMLEASYSWAPYLGDITFRADGLSTPIALTIALLCALIAIYSIKYMENAPNQSSYYALYLLYSAGMVGTVLTVNLAAFFLFFELMLLPSWALIGVWGTGNKEAIAFKYFMFTEAGALSLLAGILLIRFNTGSFNILEIAERIQGLSNTTIIGIVTLILIGLFVKMAIFPLHNWLPDAHAEAPTPISALLSPAMIGIGGYAIIRIIYTAFPSVLQNRDLILTLSAIAVITMFYGGLMALSQTDLKRLLAYSSISQMGYLLFGICSITTLGLTGAGLLYISHGFAKAILFMVSGVFMHSLNTREITKLGGLAAKMPITATVTLIAFLSLAGLPPFIGFWGEIFIFAGSMFSGAMSSATMDMGRLWVTALAVISSIITAGYGLWAVRRIFFGELRENLAGAKEASSLFLGPIIILTILTVLLGIFPTPFSTVLGEFFSQLIH